MNQNNEWYDNRKVCCQFLKDGATPRKIVAFCENCFSQDLKTNKVKYIKVYISRKGISRGIYLNSQIF